MNKKTKQQASTVLLYVVLAIIAIIALFNIQSRWNTYLGAEMYLVNPDYRVLQQVINSLFSAYDVGAEGFDPNSNVENMMELLQYRKQLMKYCVIIAGVLPLVILYPFIQKFFVKGIMVGAVKG